MKKQSLFLLLFIFTALGAQAQRPGNPVTFHEVKVDHPPDAVTLTFRFDVARKAIRNDHTLVFAPVITDGHFRVSLPPVVVQSKRGAVALDRHLWASDTELVYENALYTRNNSTEHYCATVPAQGWMDGAEIQMESLLMGCCSNLPKELGWVNVVIPTLWEEVIEPLRVEEDPGFIPRTTGDSLSIAFNFILPDTQWNATDPIYDEDRENALIVYYRVSRSEIEPAFQDNRQTLLNLIAAINVIRHSPDSRVCRIVVAGFASPEGTFQFNDRLAWERAVSIKAYIMRQTGLPDPDILLYNGSEDWRGLRALVAASSLPERDRILQIIDTYPIQDSAGRKLRLEEIKRLSGGETYRYLLDHFFPKLRNGAFIRVYYQNKE